MNRLREKTKATSGQQIAATFSSHNQEKMIVEHARILSKTQKEQLIKKFQLVHFLTVNNQSLNFCQDLVCFEKEVYKVNVRTGYLNKTAAQEILLFLSKLMITENITEPLNSGDRTYCSLLTDVSSSAKTMDEKELYVIKTCDKGKPRFDILALEQPDDAGAKGLKESLDNAVKKANLSTDRKTHEIGLGSDGTNTNKVLYKLEKEEIGDWLIQILCLSQKLELVIHDTFKQSKLNRDAEEQLELVYYLFKQANLKWRLFKRQALMMKTSNYCFKRPSGTRWVTHQSDAINAFLVNLSLLLGYLNNQIADPYNATMKKEVPRLQCVLSFCSNLVTLVFQAAKLDILNLIKPTSLVLQSTNLLLPEAVTTIKRQK